MAVQWLTLRKLRSQDYETRTRAFADAVARRDVDALLQVIDDPDEYVRSHAIRALGQVADPRCVLALIERLDDANFNNQEDAAAALARIGDSRAIGPLMAMLGVSRKHPQARRAASQALIGLADARALTGLLEVLDRADELGRALALEVLGVIGDARCVMPIIAVLRHPSENVRWHAVTALGALRDPRSVEPLLDRLAADDSASYRAIVMEALAKIGDRRAGHALSSFLNDQDHDLRASAAAALERIGWRPPNVEDEVPLLIARQRWDDLAVLGWETVRDAIATSLKDGDWRIRRDVVTGLTRLPGDGPRKALIGALEDSDEDVASAAASALAQLGSPLSIGALIEHCARYAPRGNYRNDPFAGATEQQRVEEWTKPLERLVASSADQIDAADLRQLFALEDRTFHLRVDYDSSAYGDGADEFTIEQDYAAVRQLAEDTLRRRGLTPG